MFHLEIDFIYLFINVLIYVIVFNEGTKLEWFLHEKDLIQLNINAINKMKDKKGYN